MCTSSTLDPSTLQNLYFCSTLDPSIRLNSTTSTSRNMNNTPLDPNSTSSLDPIISLHTTNSLDLNNLEPTYLRKTSFHKSLEFKDIEVETGNTVQDENFFHNIPEKQLETETEETEEDFSQVSLEEQAVLRQISLMTRQTLSN